jgi:small-conductance mechanosensitive channel
MMTKIIFLILLSCFVFADENLTDVNNTAQIITLKSKISKLVEQTQKDIWITRYNNYLTYRKIEKELQDLKLALKQNSGRTKEAIEFEYQIKNKIKIKENELELISDFKDSPIGKLIKPAEIDQVPIVSNPFSIVEAWSYVKKLKENRSEYSNILQDLKLLLIVLKDKQKLFEELVGVDNSEENLRQFDNSLQELKDFEMVVEIVSTTNEVYSKKIEQIILESEEKINLQALKTLKILSIIGVLFVIAFMIKMAVKKYWNEKDRYYVTNKIINFLLVVIVALVILFAYTENVNYLVTILGFASAGIAIALKDWFMSIFGWFVIITSGSIHVGDRIRVQRDGKAYVGDVLDISLFRITILEDITLVTYSDNRRAGRIFFIPNNYVFTELLSNYTHAGLKTVWDGIDINVTYDSNFKKAANIAKEIAKTHAKSYTEITTKQLRELKEKYSLKSTRVEPRVFTFIEPYGIKISVWFLTNSYSTLATRSIVSAAIIEGFLRESDIKIAYPTQTLRWQNLDNQALSPLDFNGSSQGLFD